jgi:TRAP-type C4-dicarboxylate transport system permease small subunit
MKSAIRRLDQFAAFTALIGEALASLAVAGMLLHISIEILARFFFGASTFVLDEFVGYMVATLVFGAAASCLRTGAHMRVGMLVDRLNVPARRVAEALALLVLLFVTVLMAKYYVAAATRAWDRGTLSQTVAEVPLWIPLVFITMGIANLALQGVARLAMLAIGEFHPEDMVEGPSDV